jgi:hypothetical protein
MIEQWQVANDTETETSEDVYKVVQPEDLDIKNELSGKPIAESIGTIPESFFGITNANELIQGFMGSEEFNKTKTDQISGLNLTKYTKGLEQKPEKTSLINSMMDTLPKHIRFPIGEAIIGNNKYDKYIEKGGNTVVFESKSETNLDIPSFSQTMSKDSTIKIDGKDTIAFITNTSIFKEITIAQGVKAKFEIFYNPEGVPLYEERTITLPNSWVDFGDNEFNQCMENEVKIYYPLMHDDFFPYPTIEVSNALSYGGYAGSLSKYSIKSETNDAFQVENAYQIPIKNIPDSSIPTGEIETITNELGVTHQNTVNPPPETREIANALAFIIAPMILGKELQDVTKSQNAPNR